MKTALLRSLVAIVGMATFVMADSMDDDSVKSKPQFLVPNKDTVWYVGNGIQETPIVLVNEGNYDVDNYKIAFLQKKRHRIDNMPVEVSTLEKGSFQYQFGSTTPIDNDQCRLKLEIVKLIADPDKAKSERFRVFRIGAQPNVPDELQFVADIVTPAYNQTYPRNNLPLKIEIAMDIASNKKMDVVLMDALTGEQVGEPTTFEGFEGDETAQYLVATIDAQAAKAGKRYFLEVQSDLGIFHKTTIIYRSAPFFLGGRNGVARGHGRRLADLEQTLSTEIEGEEIGDAEKEIEGEENEEEDEEEETDEEDAFGEEGEVYAEGDDYEEGEEGDEEEEDEKESEYFNSKY